MDRETSIVYKTTQMNTVAYIYSIWFSRFASILSILSILTMPTRHQCLRTLHLDPLLAETYTPSDLRHAYLRRAKEVHPDKHPNDAEATRTATRAFQEVKDRCFLPNYTQLRTPTNPGLGLRACII